MKIKNTFDEYPYLVKNILPYLFIFLVNFLAFGRSVEFGFHIDDLRVFDVIIPWTFWTQLYWRPFWDIWLSFADQTFNLNPFLFHLVSFVLHLSNCFLAFLLFMKLGLRKMLALAAVVLWSLLAGNAFAIVWICESTDLFAMFFLLTASLAWIKYCRSGKHPTSWSIFASFSWLMSIFSKEMGLLWPIGAFLFSYFTQSSDKQKMLSFIKNRLTSIVPLLFFILFIILKIAAQGFALGLNPTLSPLMKTQLRGLPWPLVFLGRVLHYIEGLFYTYLPLDLFHSTSGLLLGILLGICLAIYLIIPRGEVSPPNKVVFKTALGCLLLFTAHAMFNPLPRTLYVPTLGSAGILCLLFYANSKKRFLSLKIVLISVYVSMHIYMGQSTVDYFSPTSRASLIGMAHMLKHHPFVRNKQENEAFIEKQLGEYHNIDWLAEQPPPHYQAVIWRQFVKVQFRDLCNKLTPK